MRLGHLDEVGTNDYCSLNCNIAFSDNSRKLTLICPISSRRSRGCFSVCAFWAMHLKGIAIMAMRGGGKTETLSPSSTRWIKTYAMAARNVLDELYVKLLSGSVKYETALDLCQVYDKLGAIYDGSLICIHDSGEGKGLRQAFMRLRGSGNIPLRDFVRSNLLKPLGDACLDFDSEATNFASRSGRGAGLRRKHETYGIGPLSIRILESHKSMNPLYNVSFIDNRTTRLVFELAHVVQLKSRLRGEYISAFKNVIDRRKEYASNCLGFLTNGLHGKLESAVCSHAAYSSVGLGKYYALLVDDRVNEFYLDAPGNRVYIDHEKWNRCLTNIRLNRRDIEHLITHLRRETNQRLDYSIPSMKADLSCGDFNIRSSIDAAPLTRDGTALDVRKFRRVPMTVLDLILNRTISIEAAAFILFCLIFRRSITVVGETSSGKTTLVNATDICAPQWWRKITIEDAIESIPQLMYGRHQVRIQVEPLEQGSAIRLKSVETTRLLHRNPTYVLLGEIQTSEHSKALFQALASGLRVMHTVHASSPEALIRRFLIQHGISKEDLKSLELIVFIKNFSGFHGKWRRVTRVSELNFEEGSRCTVTDVFRHDFGSDTLMPLFDISRSTIVRKIMEDYPLGIEEIIRLLDSYKRFLTRLSTGRGSLPFEGIMKEFDAFNAKIAREFRLFEVTDTVPSEVALASKE